MPDNKIADNPLYQGLVDLDVLLESSVELANNGFSALDRLKELAPEIAQQEIDLICEQLSEKINSKLEEKKQEAIKAVKQKYQAMLAMLQIVKPIMDLLDLNISLDTVVTALLDTIKAFAEPYIQPYEDATKFIAEVVTEVTPLLLNITNNTDELMNVPNRLEQEVKNINPSLNLNKLQISFTPPDISDIIS